MNALAYLTILITYAGTTYVTGQRLHDRPKPQRRKTR
jgi:hypothetical protein